MVRDRSGEEVERPEGTSATSSDSQRCTWETDGRRCYLTRGFEVGRHRLCHWHYATKDNPRARDSFEEFEAWQANWRSYCSEENHWTHTEVWEAICGNADLLKVKQRRCNAVLCRKVETPLLYATPASVSVRQEVQALELRLGAQNRPRDLEAEKRELQSLVSKEANDKAQPW